MNKRELKKARKARKIKRQLWYAKNKIAILKRQEIYRKHKNNRIMIEDGKKKLIPYNCYFMPPAIMACDSLDNKDPLDNLMSPLPSPADIVNGKIVKDLVVSLIRTLSPVDQAILLCRYGFLNGEKKKLKYIGKVFKLSQERIRQRECLAIRHLRFLLNRQNIKNTQHKNIKT